MFNLTIKTDIKMNSQKFAPISRDYVNATGYTSNHVTPSKTAHYIIKNSCHTTQVIKFHWHVTRIKS